eukprot:c11312_g1_i1.p1 GENE.c11312_g1_i1~~c11312_g1_i1.p1  ORF type:complete len:172 (+),score=61.56 c11312_g1_i1:38-517(+)
MKVLFAVLLVTFVSFQLIEGLAIDRLEAQDRCSKLSSCETCSNFYDCVWCKKENSCAHGNEHGKFGAHNKTCSDFDYRKCSGQPCEYYSTCSSCTQIPMCGWCANTLQCYNIDFKGQPAIKGEVCEVFLTSHCRAQLDVVRGSDQDSSSQETLNTLKIN